MDFMKNKWFNNYAKSFIIVAENYGRLYLMIKKYMLQHFNKYGYK